MDKKKIINILLFVIIAAAAVCLRILYLKTDLWYDEACSWVSAKQSFPFGIMDNLMNLDLQHTPLYFFILHFWMKIFGDTEIPMRMLSLIFGIGTVPLVYICARKITDKTAAFFACAIAAVSPLLVLFSVEVRMYPMVVFLVLLSLNYLIDFERKKDTKSLVKLVITNIIIPYTLVGGILYNLSLWICYSVYLFKNNFESFKRYIKAAAIELVCLIPYFMLIGYYAKLRHIFVISHESYLQFFNIVDVVRNFFGSTIINNIYWPALSPYELNFLFCILVVVPCVYFVFGLIQVFKSCDKFLKTLNCIFILCFILAVIFSALRVNVFTLRYILYLLPPFFILSVIGLFSKLSAKHCKIFLTLFLIASAVFTVSNAGNFKKLKTTSFKTIKLESDKLNLTSDDIIIMPFGADAPYYFRSLTVPKVFDSDFHKEVRNPYNNRYYDKSQQDEMAGENRSRTVYYAVMDDKVFSEAFFNYFTENVNAAVPQGRYALVALYGSDVNFVTDIDTLRKSIKGQQEVEGRLLDIMFSKYMCDMAVMLNLDFDFVKQFQQDNYTFYLYQKR